MGRMQAEITPQMRTILVDWLAEVRDEYRLQGETLFLAAAYLDRFLAAAPVPRASFQLLGLTCLWLAAKFQEVHPPRLDQMVRMADDAYSRADIKDMEAKVLFTLQFDLTLPTPFRFLHYLLELSPLPPHPDDASRTRRLAEALLELSLLDTAFLLVPPSAVAATAVYTAMEMVGHDATLDLEDVADISGADESTLRILGQRLAAVLCNSLGGAQYCALAQRYIRWERAHGSSAFKVAAAKAAVQVAGAQPWSPPAAQLEQRSAAPHDGVSSGAPRAGDGPNLSLRCCQAGREAAAAAGGGPVMGKVAVTAMMCL